MAGIASPAGFHLYGSLSTKDVSAAASEALQRLRSGERELAVSPYCGTNLIVGALLAGVLSGIIMGREGIQQAYHTGHGRVVIRARAFIEEMERGGNRERIVVTELPYQVNKAAMVEKIAMLS